MKPDISLFIFDIHNTICDFWNRWANATYSACKTIADSRNIPLDTFLEEAQKLDPLYRFHDFRRLIENLEILHPLQPIDYQQIEAWQKDIQAVQPYDGVYETFESIRKAGGKIVLWTDSSQEAAFHDMRHIAGGPFTPDMVDGLYCQPKNNLNFTQIPVPAFLMPDETDHWLNFHRYMEWFEDEHKVFSALPARQGDPTSSKKPNANALRYICKTQGVAPERCLVVDDNANGGINLPDGMRFALQKAGNMLEQKTLWLHNERLNNPDYVIGWEATSAKLVNLAIKPDAILENGIPDILSYFCVRPNHYRPAQPSAPKP